MYTSSLLITRVLITRINNNRYICIVKFKWLCKQLYFIQAYQHFYTHKFEPSIENLFYIEIDWKLKVSH